MLARWMARKNSALVLLCRIRSTRRVQKCGSSVPVEQTAEQVTVHLGG